MPEARNNYDIDRDSSQARKARNRESSIAHLQKVGVPFELRNGNSHVLIRIPGLNIDFWPSTGLWRHLSHSKTVDGRGVFNLIKYMEERAWKTLKSMADNPPPTAAGSSPSSQVAAIFQPRSQPRDDDSPF